MLREREAAGAARMAQKVALARNAMLDGNWGMYGRMGGAPTLAMSSYLFVGEISGFEKKPTHSKDRRVGEPVGHSVEKPAILYAASDYL